MKTAARLVILSLLLNTGCGGGDDFEFPESTQDAVDTYARIVQASYADSHTAAVMLSDALANLIADPSQGTLDQARLAWLDSREPYLQTEVYRFYDGPIDDPETGPEGLLNAWPLDEHYIDYVEGDDGAGLINGTDAIDVAALSSLNEVGGEKNISTGFHAIEFLLWGQDQSETGPGDRPFTDYVTDGTGTADNQDRRGQYLGAAGDLLVQNLGELVDAWAPAAAYRTDFESDAQVGMERILTGMIVLSGFETGGERLQASLDSGDQEDEHSCFSDNTHRDMIQDVQGIYNVWHGSYTDIQGNDISGTGVKTVVADVDSDLADRLTAQIDQSLSLANALQPPYDQEIAAGSAGQQRVQDLVVSLHDQEALLFEVFEVLGLTVEIPE